MVAAARPCHGRSSVSPRLVSRVNPLCLGSMSPRRRQLLGDLGIELRVVPADIEEAVRAGEGADQYLERMASSKLAAVAARTDALRDCAGLLVADTIVVAHDQILGKPVDVEEAFQLLSLICGRVHEVQTRYAIAQPPDWTTARCARTVTTLVEMRAGSAEELRRYAATGEGLDKAGAYAAQGLGCFLIRGVTGSYTNVVGLPVCEVVEDLKTLGMLGDFP